MSDHDAPHPVDRAYAEAETLLDNDAARRARRARVLDAVAREAPPAVPLPRGRARPGWKYAGWLTAAGLTGLGALIALEFAPTGGFQPAPTPRAVPSSPAPGPEDSSAPSLSGPLPSAPPPQLERAPQTQERGSEVSQTAAAPAPPPAVAPPPVMAPPAPPRAPAAPPPPTAFPASPEGLESVEAHRAAPPVAAQAPAARAQAAANTSPAALGARLRVAAASGRTGEVAELLAEGAPVDARDGDGETALMKSVRAGHGAIVALLRRHGADPDLENRAGVSARQMVEAADSPSLERALTPSGGAR